MFAAIAGVLLSTQEGLVTYVLPFLVIYSFAPAVLGRLTNLPLAFAGAFALGVVDQHPAKYGSSERLRRSSRPRCPTSRCSSCWSRTASG